jgi:DNA-binding transcriptional regulator YiaG
VECLTLAAIRARTGLSRGEFARSIGVGRCALLNRERGRRCPTEPSHVLLVMIGKMLSLVKELPL